MASSQKSRDHESLWDDLSQSTLVRRMLAALGDSWGITAHFTDARGWIQNTEPGKILLAHNDVCEAIVRSKKGYADRKETALQMTAKAASPKKQTQVSRCATGTSVVTFPIAIEDVFVGSLYLDGFIYHETAEEQRLAIAAYIQRTIDDNADEVEALIPKIKVVDDRDLQLISAIAGAIVDEGVANQNRLDAAYETISEMADEIIGPDESFRGIIGNSPKLKELFWTIEKMGQHESTVLITGESGSGKEMVAKAIHNGSKRGKQTFTAINCGAFNENLLESELFGHVKGSFTGATSDKKGLFETASKGTLFLDEVGEMDLAMQVKLLRVLQEGTYMPVGSTKLKSTKARIIAATHRDLPSMIKKKEFREDLYYRLNVINLTVPPLRERKTDVPLLLDFFLHKHAPDRAADLQAGPETLQALERYSWPGNVRELENEVQRLIVFADPGVIPPTALSDKIQKESKKATDATVVRPELQQSLEGFERQQIIDGLRRLGGNKSALAKELGISRTALNQRIKKLDISDAG